MVGASPWTGGWRPSIDRHGLLVCRSDLLHEYGDRGPPSTWSEARGDGPNDPREGAGQGNTCLWGSRARSRRRGADLRRPRMAGIGGRRGDLRAERRRVGKKSPSRLRLSRAASWVGTISPAGIVADQQSDAKSAWPRGTPSPCGTGPRAMFRARPRALPRGTSPGGRRFPRGARWGRTPWEASAWGCRGFPGINGKPKRSFVTSGVATPALALAGDVDVPHDPDLYDDRALLKAGPVLSHTKDRVSALAAAPRGRDGQGLRRGVGGRFHGGPFDSHGRETGDCARRRPRPGS